MQSDTKTNRARGRPRKFDRDEALNQATATFWSRGLSGASLDDLASAMNMKRPSIYNAFGDKETLYRTAFENFCEHMRASAEQTLGSHKPLRHALLDFFYAAIKVYTSDSQPLGCFVMCTAPSETGLHPDIASDLAAVIEEIDSVLAARFRRAIDSGELGPADHKLLGQLTQSQLHSLALRARAGSPAAGLRALARGFVKTLMPGER